VHKHPEKVLVIGLGSGVSAGSALALDSIQQVDVVEMSPEVVAASWWFRDYNCLTYVEDRLETPRMRLLINDGRNHLLLTSRTYDVIASEPSNPWMAGVANLFTKEAFELSRARLNKGGVMCQWLHSYSLEESDFLSVVRTFAEVFPHVQLWCNASTDFLLIGSEERLELPMERLREVLRQPNMRRLVAQVNLDSEYEFAGNYLASEKALWRVAGQEVLQTDDNLKLEFSAHRALYMPTRAFRSLRFSSQPEDVLQLGAMPLAERAAAIRDLDLAAAAREHTHFAWEIGRAHV
jgi:spermidine synthase